MTVHAVAVLTAVLAQGEARSHPFLFLTPDSVQHARRAMHEHEDFAALAAQLEQRAREVRIEDLPELEHDWWPPIKETSWHETYPPIFRHTMLRPAQWARAARSCARAGLLLDDSELLETAKEVMFGVLEYTFEYEHFDVGLNYTIWVMQILETYDIVFERLDDDAHRRMDAFFQRALAAVDKNHEYWVEHEPGGPMNNHYAWHALCFMMLGLFYDRPELVDKALDTPKGVVELFEHGFRDNGLWMEGSIPYQFTATAAFLVMAELMDNAGHPRGLWDYQTADGRGLRQSYDALIPLLFPDRTLPPIGDSYARRNHLGKSVDYELLHRRFGDPTHGWLLRDYGQRHEAALFGGVADLAGDPPPMFSGLWPEQGYLALRSREGRAYWSGEGWTLFGTYSNSPVHTNQDKLSIMLFADGHLWLPDREAATGAEHPFSANIQAHLNRSTICHNTVMVDGLEQQHPNRRLDLVEYHALPRVKRASFGDLDGRLYPGVRQLRTCIVRDEYVLDVFQLIADETREWTWLLHVDGEPGDGSHNDWMFDAFPDAPPWRFLRQPERAQGQSHAYWEQFTRDGKSFRVDLLAGQAFDALRCGFPQDDSVDPELRPMRMFRSQGADAWYLAVYRRGGACDLPLRVAMDEGALESWAVTINLDGAEYRHRAPMLRSMP